MFVSGAPESYTITETYFSDDGDSAILHLRDNAGGTSGIATLIKVDGEWKVENSNWESN